MTPRIPPYRHQVEGISRIVDQPYFFLADEMGAGKSKQTIDAAMVLYQKKIIDRVVVIAPASVRSVWFDQEFGELRKHLWDGVWCEITEFHSKMQKWFWLRDGAPEPGWTQPSFNPRLRWVITNYEFIRSPDHLKQLLSVCNKKTLLVLDESSAIKSYKAKQTKACMAVRKKCGRVLLLNGTPISNNPGDLFSQAYLMDPSILGCQNWFHFRARYAILGGWKQKQIVDWRDLDDLQKRLAPYVIRRLKIDCLDLPPKLPPVTYEVPMTLKSWRIYKEMREEMVAWLTSGDAAVARQAAVKTLRLAQITSGFVGGIERIEDEEQATDTVFTTTAIGTEKADFIIERIKDWLEENPVLKIVVFCRFRPELAALLERLRQTFHIPIGAIWGGQSKASRYESLRLLDPVSAPKGPAIVLVTPGSGSKGLTFAAASVAVYLSHDHNLGTRLQSEDRLHRPGQVNPVSYYDVIATGPNGQRTIDHAIVKAVHKKVDVASWTTAAWVEALQD